MIEPFHFLRPAWLAALPGVALAWWWFRATSGRASAWARVCRPEFLPLLVGGDQGDTVRPATADYAALAALLAVIALAGPTWEKLPAPVFRDDAPLVIAFDLSNSMLAEDVTPSRFERARFKIADLLNAREAGQTALLAYAAQAFAVTPLTTDVDTITALLPALDPEIVPTEGSRPDRALERAIELIAQAGGSGRGDVLFVTDGVEEGALAPLIEAAEAAGVAISALGIGTESGAPIPDPSGTGFLRNAGGVIVAKLDPAPLAQLAEATGGRYVSATPGPADVTALSGLFNARIGGPARADDVSGYQRWRDMGPWVLLAALPFAALIFRRGAVFALFLSVGTALPGGGARALELPEWFLNRDQRGLEAFEDRDYETASEKFASPRWQAATAFRRGDYERAIELLEPLDDVESIYNRGNALAELERYEEAIAAYDEVLARDPDHEDAAYNKAYLENLPKRPPQGGGGQGDSEDEKSENEDAAGSESQSESSSQPPSESSESQSQGQAGENEDSAASDAPAGSEPTDKAADEQQRRAEQAPEREDEPSRDEGEDADETAVAELPGTLDERRQATEQWLRRIPDDPAGLLRRKFRYQYRQRAERLEEETQPW